MATPTETLRQMKKRMTYAKLAQATGLSECNLKRWITGKTNMSPAWSEIVKERLKNEDRHNNC